MKTGKQALIEQFLEDGITYMFGNPGTVEQGFLNEIKNYSQFHYITCLQETIAVAMADGYARKTKKPALVQLHRGVGLGNGIGMLYQAYRGHSPLIVIAGEAGIKYSSMDSQMACDLVQMAKPVTKYADRVVHKDSLLRLVRRAIKIAKNHTVTYGIQANIKSSLIMLNSELLQNMNSCYEQIVQERFGDAMNKNAINGSENLIKLRKNPVAYDFFGYLKARTGSNLILFDEALTASSYLSEFLPQEKDGTFFQTRGGSLGVGIPGAIGIKLAQPDAQVIGFTGDGGSMYTIQALYTAMRYKIAAKFVICNNGNYQLLKDNMNAYWKEESITESVYPDCFSLSPVIDFVKIAEAMGVKALRVKNKTDIVPAVEQMLGINEPFLIDLIIADIEYISIFIDR